MGLILRRPVDDRGAPDLRFERAASSLFSIFSIVFSKTQTALSLDLRTNVFLRRAFAVFQNFPLFYGRRFRRGRENCRFDSVLEFARIVSSQT